jgi:hypothetical protein
LVTVALPEKDEISSLTSVTVASKLETPAICILEDENVVPTFPIGERDPPKDEPPRYFSQEVKVNTSKKITAVITKDFMAVGFKFVPKIEIHRNFTY